MDFSLIQIISLLPFGILAGIISSSVGMASLVSYPALLYITGLPPVFANVTNTASVIYNGIGSGLSSIPELKGHFRQLLTVTICMVIGSSLGALLLINFSSKSFPKLVPFFIFFAALTILWPHKSHVNNHNKELSRMEHLLSMVALILTGGYIGYFGAASGVIANAILSRVIGGKYANYNAIRNVASFFGNLIAMVLFIFNAHIYWILVLPLGTGILIGSYLGPKLVRRIPDRIMKLTMGVLAILLSIDLFIQAYF